MTIHALRINVAADVCACRCPDNGHRPRACDVEPVAATLDGVRLCQGCTDAILADRAESNA